jgi:hypothetical protein
MDFLALQADFLKKAEPMMDNYKERINVVASVVADLKNPRMTMSDFDKASLAMMYDNIDSTLLRYKKLKNLSDRTFSETVGPYKKHAYNIISAMYTTLEIRDIISIQPLLQKRGAIYKMIYEFASNKGSIREGDTMFSPDSAGKRSRYYSSQIIDGEPVVFTFDTTDSQAILEYFPIIKPEKISIVVTGGAAAGTYTYLNAVNGIYNLQKGSVATAVGTLNPINGLLTLLAVDATGATSTVATYNWNSEKFSNNSQIPRVTIGVTEQEVTAERRNLMIDTMLDVSYDFETQFGQALNSQLETTVIQYLQNEFAFRILGEMYDGSTGNGGTTFTFSTTPSFGTTLQDHAQQLYKMLAEMSSKIRKNVGRGWGNKIVCGDNMLNFLKVLSADEFVRAPKPKGDGPYYAGNINGDYDVYYNPDIPATGFMMLYKGETWWDAAYYVGTYLPLMNSQFLLYPDMHGEQGYIAMDSFSYEYPQMVVKGTIS